MTRTSGSAGGPRKRTSRKVRTAPRSDLDHTAAGLMIAANVHPKVIQSRLGHGEISVTLDTYGHLLPSLDEKVADDLKSAHRATKIGPSSAPRVHDLQDGTLDQ